MEIWIFSHFPIDNYDLYANLHSVMARNVESDGGLITGANGGNGEGNDEFLISVISVFSCSKVYVTIIINLVNIAIPALRRQF